MDASPGQPPDQLPGPTLEDPEYRAAVIDLLGVLAYGELSAFVRLAADAALGPASARRPSSPGWRSLSSGTSPGCATG